MGSKNFHPGICAGAVALLLALSWSSAQAAGTGVVALDTSIKPVATAPAVGPVNPVQPFVSRATLQPAESAATMSFEVVLKMRNFADLRARLAKGGPVSPAEMEARYEPFPADYQAVTDWLIGHGLIITHRDPHHMAIFVRGTVSQIQQAMQVTFARVTAGGREYTSAVTAPRVPAALAPLLVGLNGLQPHLRAHKHLRWPQARATPDAGAGNTSYIPSQIEQAYNANSLYNQGLFGSGQTIAIVIDTFPASSDLELFWKNCGVSQSINNIQFIQVVSGTLAAPSGEETLDTEWSSAMAPSAKVRIYATLDLESSDLDEGYQQVYEDVLNHPEYGIHQMSLSFGEGETYTSDGQALTDDQYFAELAAAGVSIFASSGDGGSTPDANGGNRGPQQTESPASDPNVTSVGGTTLTLNANNTVNSEVGWSDSGGGTSIYFGRPAWQSGAGVPAGAYRVVPDVACSADPNKGAVVFLNGASTILGGTSWSTPMWAGFCALLNQARVQCGQPSLGVLGPGLYPLLGTSSYATDIRDITSGNNGYAAGSNYDLVTGLGTPLLAGLLATIIQPKAVPVAQTITPGQNAVFSVATRGAPTTYAWERMPFGTTSWITLSDNGTYAGSATATLTVNGVTTAMSGDQFRCAITLSGSAVATPSSTLVVDEPLIVSAFAGQVGVTGLQNGTGTGAQFKVPSGAAVDSFGNVFIADFSNNQIREITPEGVVTTPYGSPAGTAGSANGQGNSATFNQPNGIAVDSSNNLYVADSGNNEIRKIIASSGQVITLASGFNTPLAVALDSLGNVYVADTNNEIIRKISTVGTVSTIAGQTGVSGYANGTGTAALFNTPTGIAVDSAGNVYVADLDNYVIRKISTGVVTTPYGQAGVAGHLDGAGNHALFNTPIGLAIDSANNIYVADSQIPPATTSTLTGNNLVRHITPAGVISTIAGQAGVTGSANGTGTAATFYSLQALAVGGSGIIYLADTFNQLIRAGAPPTTLTVTATQPAAAVFGPVAGQFTVNLNNGSPTGLTVNYTVAGSAIAGTDYTALAGSLSIPAGTTSGVITVNPLFNSSATSSPTVQLTLGASASYAIGSPASAVVTITEPTPYQAWKLTEFGANAYVSGIGGDLDDPNNNGVPNLLEYAFNSNPLQTGTEPLPVTSLVTVGDNQYLAITYTQINTDPGLTYTVQVTSDLTQQTDQWHSGPTYTTVVSQQVNGNTTQVTVRDNTPTSQDSLRFIRVQVTGP